MADDRPDTTPLTDESEPGPVDAGRSISVPNVFRWTAGAVAVAAVGVLGWSFWSAGHGPALQRPQNLPHVGQAPSFNRPALPITSSEDFPNLLAGATQGALQLFNDNGVYAQINYERLDPKPAGRIDLTAPTAWFYLDGGRAVHIEAERGWLVQQPGVSRPEAGDFDGDVRITLHQFVDRDPREAIASQDPLPAPTVTMTTQTLHFDAAIGEIAAPGEVRFAGPGFRATLSDLDVRINEAERKLASLRSENGGSFRWAFASAGDESDAASQARAEASADDQRSRGAKRRDAPQIDLYEATIEDAIAIAWAGRTLDADLLNVWMRIVDGALPDGALFNVRGSASAADGSNAQAGITAALPVVGDASASTEADGFTPDIVATWTGELRVEPMAKTPRQLQDDSIALRFTSPTRGAVEVKDPAGGLFASCVSLDAGLSRGRMVMTGAGDVGVSLRREGAGVALAGRFEFDAARGLGAFPGPGVIRAVPRTLRADLPPVRRDISWRGRADLLFATRDGAVDFTSPAPLREALFSDDVEAHDGGTILSGQSLRAVFQPVAGRSGLARLIVEDDALLDADDRGRLAAQRLDVRFRDAEEGVIAADQTGALGAVEPDVATAEGAVRAQQGGASLRAELVEARFGRDDAGELAVSTVTASTAVKIRTPQGDVATADSMRANLISGSADLLGEPARITRKGASVEGGSMRLNRSEGSLVVFGQGALRYEPETPVAPGYRFVTVVWTRLMQYDGRAGTVEFEGTVDATGQSQTLRDVIRGERVEVDLVRSDAAGSTGAASGDPFAAIGNVRKATAIAGDGDDDTANVESRRYAADADGKRRLAQLVFLEGKTITADNETGRLVVPGAGRLLVERRPDATGEDDGRAQGDTFSLGKGTTLFEWAGNFTLLRAESTATMTQSVRLRQLPPGASEAAVIECERIDASFAPQEGVAGASQLRSAEATGAVYASLGTRELIADSLVYDAVKAALAARANPPNTIVLFDHTQPVPLTGAALIWDLARDRVDWKAAGTISAPASGFSSAGDPE